MLGYTWKTRGKIFLTNILVIAFFGTIGFTLDHLFHKKAFFIFIFVLISFPIPTLIIRRMVHKERALKPQKIAPETEKLDTTSVKRYLR